MTRRTLLFPAPGALAATRPRERNRIASTPLAVVRGSSGALSVTVASGIEALLALEPVWEGLRREAGAEEPFSSHAWLRTWCESFRGGDKLRMLVVRDADRVVGALPLLGGRRLMYGCAFATLRSPWNPHTPRCDLLVAASAPEVCRALLDGLERSLGSWDVLQLPQLPAESPLLRCFAPLAAARGYRIATLPGSSSPFIPIGGSWQDYLESRSPKLRENLRRVTRRLSERGRVALEVVEGTGGLERALDEGFALEAAAWKRAAGSAIVSHPEVERFYRRLARRAAERGELQLQFLTLDHRRIAFAYSLRCGDRLFSLKIGYDPAYATFSPGRILTALVLEDAFARGLSAYDLLGEAERWKLAWTDRLREHQWLYVFRDSTRTRFLHLVKFHIVPRLRADRAGRPRRGTASGDEHVLA